jgi:hypothetical protein
MIAWAALRQRPCHDAANGAPPAHGGAPFVLRGGGGGARKPKKCAHSAPLRDGEAGTDTVLALHENNAPRGSAGRKASIEHAEPAAALVPEAVRGAPIFRLRLPLEQLD